MCSLNEIYFRDFSGGPVARTLLSVQGAQVQSLVRELDPICCPPPPQGWSRPCLRDEGDAAGENRGDDSPLPDFLQGWKDAPLSTVHGSPS